MNPALVGREIREVQAALELHQASWRRLRWFCLLASVAVLIASFSGQASAGRAQASVLASYSQLDPMIASLLLSKASATRAASLVSLLAGVLMLSWTFSRWRPSAHEAALVVLTRHVAVAVAASSDAHAQSAVDQR